MRGELSGWPVASLRLLVLFTAAQQAAAAGADEYVNAVVGETETAGAVAAAALAGVASDGRPLGSLLEQPAIATRVALSQGATQSRAFATGEAALSMILRTQVADAGRVADGVAIAARPRTGYVRMLVGSTCSRCAVLAGKFYRYNDGFLRHPRCDCLHIPAKGEAAARSEGLISDPKEYFDSLSKSEQDRVFTNAGAQAIRDGANPSQVVNARRGARGLSQAGRLTLDEQRMLRGGRARGQIETVDVFGRQVFVTTEGTTRRGLAGRRLSLSGTVEEAGETVRRLSRTGVVERQVRRQRARAPRLMPESIYQLADSREHAILLLRKFGYII